jgi:hypothetical protein
MAGKSMVNGCLKAEGMHLMLLLTASGGILSLPHQGLSNKTHAAARHPHGSEDLIIRLFKAFNYEIPGQAGDDGQKFAFYSCLIKR